MDFALSYASQEGRKRERKEAKEERESKGREEKILLLLTPGQWRERKERKGGKESEEGEDKELEKEMERGKKLLREKCLQNEGK